MHDIEHSFLQTDHMVAAAAVHTAAGLFSSVFWGTLQPVQYSPRPPWITSFLTRLAAAARYLYFFVRCLRATLFCWVLCALGVAPVRYFDIFFEFPAVELLRAPLPSRPVCFMLCVLGVAPVRYFYIFFFELPCFELLRPWCACASRSVCEKHETYVRQPGLQVPLVSGVSGVSSSFPVCGLEIFFCIRTYLQGFICMCLVFWNDFLDFFCVMIDWFVCASPAPSSAGLRPGTVSLTVA